MWSAIALRAVAFLTASAALAGSAEECERRNDQGEYAAALPSCEAAVEAARSSPDRAALARSLNGLGLALEMTGDRPSARRAYHEALALHRALAARDQEALVLSNLAALAIGAGDYGLALSLLEQEEAVARGAGDARWVEEELRIVALNRGVALEQLGAYREALAVLRRLAEGPEPDPGHAAALQVNLAVLYRNLGDPRRALRLLDIAIAALERIGDNSALANAHLNRGLVLAENLDEPGAARREMERALALARDTGDRAEELRTLQALGELELARGRIAEARRGLEGALALARSSGARAGEWSALAALGRVEKVAGDTGLALERLRAAARIVEQASSGVSDPALGSALLADQRRLYGTAVDLLGARAVAGDAPAALEALAWSERLKDRELLDALAGRRAAQPLSESGLAALGERIAPALAYFFGESRLWRWQLESGRLEMADAGDARQRRREVRAVHDRLARGEEPDAALLAALAAALVPSGLPPQSVLRIAPDGELFYLPFPLLRRPGDSGDAVVATRAISTVPSLSTLARLLERGAGAGPAPRWRFAAIAAPATRSAAEAPPGAGEILASRFGLPPLPGGEREARSAARRLGEPSSLSFAGEASERRLRERAREGAEVLHVAAHTLVDEGLGQGVAIFLAAGAEGISEDDGLLTPAELARLDGRFDLVVLSGCRTAIAGEAGGSGRAMASLSGALLGAGARGVVASLWKVSDVATAALMQEFYDALGDGALPAEALRDAQARLAGDERWRAPYYWSGWVLVGDAPALSARQRWPLLAAALVGAGVVLWAAASRRRARPSSGN